MIPTEYWNTSTDEIDDSDHTAAVWLKLGFDVLYREQRCGKYGTEWSEWRPLNENTDCLRV